MSMQEYSELIEFLKNGLNPNAVPAGKSSSTLDGNQRSSSQNDGKTSKSKVEESAPAEVNGVNFHCYGEVWSTKLPLVQAVKVSRGHAIFAPNAEISPFSRLIGMPLAVWKYPKKHYPGNRSNCHSNVGTTFMMLNCDPASDRFGWAPPHWQAAQVPSVLVVRTDGASLAPKDVEWFGDFCSERLQPVFEAATEGRMTRQDALNSITPDRWSQYRQSRQNAGETEFDRWKAAMIGRN